jgi:hypothetical protein
LLGTGIFNVCKDVKAYIVTQLYELVEGLRGRQAALKESGNADFRKIRESFLRQHKKHIQDSLSDCFSGKVDLKPAPVSPAVEKRFLRCYKKHCARGASCLVPALHGTDPKNYQSILRRGLLVPGLGNEIAIAHGSAYGVGIYTAKLCNPFLSRGFAPAASLLICAVIDDARADAFDGATHAGMSYPIRYRLPRTKRSSAKHLTDYVEELEVWNEWDPYASDVWGWEVDPVGGRYLHDGPSIYSGRNVKHALDSMVIFDSSHVVPLFIATRPFVNMWPGSDDEISDLDADVVISVNVRFGPSGRTWHWQRLKCMQDVNDRVVRRGWVARYGHRDLLSGRKSAERYGETGLAKRVKRKGSHAYACNQQERDSNSCRQTRQCKFPDAARPIQNLHARRKLNYKLGRTSLKQEWRRDIVADVHEASISMHRECDLSINPMQRTNP